MSFKGWRNNKSFPSSKNSHGVEKIPNIRENLFTFCGNQRTFLHRTLDNGIYLAVDTDVI